MAGKGKVQVEIGITGEAQYNQSIKNINASQKALRSEMKSLEASFKGQANSITALQSKYENLSRQYELQQTKVDRYASSLEKAQANEQKANEKVVASKRAYDEAAQKLDELRQANDENSDAVREAERHLEELNGELRSNVSALDNAATATQNAQNRYNTANAELRTLGNQLEQTNQYLEEARASSDGTASSIDGLGREMQQAETDTDQFSRSLTDGLVKTGLYLAMQAAEKLVDGIREIGEACIESGSNFEAGMSKVAAVSGATGADLDALTEKARQMGATTMFSASEAAEAMNYMAMAGWKTEDMLSGVEGVMALAAASGTDLATTSDIVTDALTAFGLTASDSAHFADVLAAASSNANTNVEMMGETFSYTAPIAGALGYSVEDTAEAIGLMANAGIKASSAGTALRRIMTEMASGIKITSSELGTVTIQTTNADGTMRGLSETLDECREVFSHLSEAEKAVAAESIAGKNAMSGFLALMNAAPQDVEKLSTALDNADGAAKRMADTMQDNLQGKITIMKSALEGLQISAYDTFSDSFKKGVDGATEAITRLDSAIKDGDLGVSLAKLGDSSARLLDEVVDGLVDALPMIIDGMATLVDNASLIGTAITSMVTAWGTYKVATEAATIATQLMSTGLTGLAANPLMLAVAGVAALGTALVGLAGESARANERILESKKIMPQLAKETENLVKSSKDASKSFAETSKGIADNGETAKRLAQELISLNEKWGEGRAGSEGFTEAIAQQKNRIDALNEAMPGLNLSIDEQTGKLNQNADAIRASIDALQARAEAEAISQRYTEIAKERLALETQQTKVSEELTTAEGKYKDALDAKNEAQKAYNAETDRFMHYDVVENLEEAKEAHMEAASEMMKYKGAQAEINTQLEALDEETEALNARLEENAQKNTDAGASADSAAASINRFALSEEELTEFTEAVNKSLDDQINLLAKAEEAQKHSGGELKSNLESQVESLTEWKDGFVELSQKAGGAINEGLLQQLAEMGPQGAGYIQGFLEMSNEAFEEYMAEYSQALTLKETTASAIIDSYMNAGQESGETLATEITDSIDESASDIESKAQGVVEDANKAAKTEAENASETGKQIDESTAEGVEKNQDTPTNATKQMSENVVKTAEKTLSKNTFQKMGKNAMLALAQGIKSGSSSVVAAMKAVADAAVKQAEKSMASISSSAGGSSVSASSTKSSSADAISSTNKQMSAVSLGGTSKSTSASGLDSKQMTADITNAIQTGLKQMAFNVNASANKDAIVDITVEANNQYKTEKGVSRYV